MSNIVSNLNIILKRIERACLDSMRDPAEVKLLLATKTVPSERIKEALQEGQTLIAENKVQEIKEKYEDLRSIPHTSHFIGHLQSNKIKDILKYDISCIQSLDRLEIAEKLQQRLAYEDRKIDVLIQINTSGEQSKFGIHPDEAIELVKSVSEFDNIKIKGLMTIGLFSAEAEKVRPCFRLLKQIQQEIIAEQIHNVNMHELSMGMSGDLETAIEEGSTIVRVGTAIFGPRIYANSYYWNESRLG
ncbi:MULTISPECIES: YggS family pyridoxal phosphate-dependent enzyme [Sphingobacterium]|uniref:YggS family pyridoxal phosphate-dependent enzyme n=1 Tax=Sphingobacterium TaxID=28453 RepID=UPI0013DAD3A2|nr:MULTISPECIES: YggS family pyridoxal phosphate-dependent enzyme [unclassified Sphingobacterium]